MEIPIKMDDLGVPLFLETPTTVHGKVVVFCQVTVAARRSRGKGLSERGTCFNRVLGPRIVHTLPAAIMEMENGCISNII